MAKYKNLSQRSGVDTYKSTKGKLAVKFNDGSTYTYTGKSAGKYPMQRMRQLAKIGRGLNAYINKAVGKNYSSKTI